MCSLLKFIQNWKCNSIQFTSICHCNTIHIRRNPKCCYVHVLNDSFLLNKKCYENTPNHFLVFYDSRFEMCERCSMENLFTAKRYKKKLGSGHWKKNCGLLLLLWLVSVHNVKYHTYTKGQVCKQPKKA